MASRGLPYILASHSTLMSHIMNPAYGPDPALRALTHALGTSFLHGAAPVLGAILRAVPNLVHKLASLLVFAIAFDAADARRDYTAATTAVEVSR